jgi:hypothetical protein
MGKEWEFKDGGKVKHKARLDEDDDGYDILIIDNAAALKGLDGYDEKTKTYTVYVNTDPDGKPTGKGPPVIDEKSPQAKALHIASAYFAYAFLNWFGNNKKKYGDWVTIEFNGRLVIGLYEEHPADKGINHPHPGCSLKDAGPLDDE